MGSSRELFTYLIARPDPNYVNLKGKTAMGPFPSATGDVKHLWAEEESKVLKAMATYQFPERWAMGNWHFYSSHLKN